MLKWINKVFLYFGILLYTFISLHDDKCFIDLSKLYIFIVVSTSNAENPNNKRKEKERKNLKSQDGGGSKEGSDSVFRTVWWQALAKFSLQTDENFEFLTDTLFRFLRFDGAKIPIVIENHPVFGCFFSDETSIGLMHFRDFLS